MKYLITIIILMTSSCVTVPLVKGVNEPTWDYKASEYKEPNPYREWHEREAETCCRSKPYETKTSLTE